MEDLQPKTNFYTSYRLLIFGSGILLFGLGLITGYLVKIQSKKITPENQKKVSVNNKNDLKTFTNFAYSYQLQIPSKWHIYGRIIINDKTECIEDYARSTEVYISDLTLDDCSLQENTMSISISPREININNTNGTRENEISQKFGKKVGIYHSPSGGDILYFNHEGKGYTLNVDNKYKDLLLSFRLINQKELTSIPTPTPLSPNYNRRLYMSQTPRFQLPQEIINHPDSELIGLSCFSSEEEPIYQKIKKLANSSESVIDIKYCFLEDNRILFALYRQVTQSVVVDFGIYENDMLKIKSTFDPGFGSGGGAPTYFTSLVYTKDNKFYYFMDEGDNTPHIKIHKVDLSSGAHNVIQTCVGDYDETGNMKDPLLTCR